MGDVEQREVNDGLSSCSECSCEACCTGDGIENNAEDSLQLQFTHIKNVSNDTSLAFVAEDLLPTSLAPLHPSEGLAVTFEDEHDRQTKLKTKKLRRCTFCKVHGFSINVKGHKPFCQFREKCVCKGCVLIRGNQTVSKNQVRLRRQKDMEINLVQIAPEPASIGQHLEALVPSKKSPMCFKCLVHDSIRVRLKGHRSVCPYAKCACLNCALNTDRKRLTRELRQLMEEVKDKRKTDKQNTNEFLSTGSGCLHLPSSDGIFSTDKMDANGQYNSSCFGTIPMKMHNAGNCNLRTMVSGISSSSYAPEQETGQFQSILSTIPYYSTSVPLNGQVFHHDGCNKHTSVGSVGNWLPDMNLVPASYNDMVYWNNGSLSTHGECEFGFSFSNVTPAHTAQGSKYGLFPQNSVCRSAQAKTAVMQLNHSYMTYPFCSSHTPRYYQQVAHSH